MPGNRGPPTWAAIAELAIYPVQSEGFGAGPLYHRNFVFPASEGRRAWLQGKPTETFRYGVYGIDDWHQLRLANDLSLGRIYDYPHMVDMWLSKRFAAASTYPQITTAWPATNYLQAAWGTALAMYTVAGASPSSPGCMSEVVFPDLLNALARRKA